MEYESRDVRVIQISSADLDRLQLAGLPTTTPPVLDFGTTDADAFKWYGISEPTTSPASAHDFAVLRDRQPSSLRFTMQGYKYDPIGPPNRTAALRMRLPVQPIHLELDVSTQVPEQAVSVSVNEHEVLHAVPVPTGEVRTLSVEIPAADLSTDGLQVLTLTHARGSSSEKLHPLRLYQLRWR